MPTFPEAMEQAEALLDHQQLMSAMRVYRRATLDLDLNRERALFVYYNLGVIQLDRVGNGMEARMWFDKALRYADPTGSNPELAELEANAWENMMLLSLSYEEYDNYAERLARLQPDNPILRVQQPDVHKMRAEGQPWSAVLRWMASNYASPDPARDRGRYGFAAATYDLLLKDRRELRLTRADHRLVVIAYGAMKVLLFSQCGARMKGALGRVDGSEFRFLLEEAMPLVVEYVQANPSDAEALKTLALMHNALDGPAAQPQPEGMGHRGWSLGASLSSMLSRTGAGRPAAPIEAGGSETKRAGLGWEVPAALKNALAAGIAGLEFRLECASLRYDDVNLILTFRSLAPVPADKTDDVSRALRTVVGLTLSRLAQGIKGFRVVPSPVRHNAGFPGVTLEAPILKSGQHDVGPLVAKRGEPAGCFVVEIEAETSMDRISPPRELVEKAMGQLIPAFEALRSQPLVLTAADAKE
jgi:hypothetical protein